MTWLAHLQLPRGLLSDRQRDMALVLTSQVEILTRLNELKRGPVVVAPPGDRGAALAELWQIRDLLAETDPDLAARFHGVYNALVVSHPGPDAA